MIWFKNLKIRTKLLLCFFVLVIFTSVVGIVGVTSLKTVNNSSQEMYDMNYLPSMDLKTIQVILQEIRAVHLSALYERNADSVQTKVDTIKQLVEKDNKMLADYEASIQDDKDRQLYQNVIDSLAAYRTVRDANMKMIEEQNYDQALAALAEVTSTREKVDADLGALVDYNSQMAADTLKNNNDNYARLTAIMIAIIIACVVFALLLGIYMASIISKPVNLMVQAAKKLAIGDINVDVEIATKDEIGNLADSFNQMIHNIRSQALIVEQLATGDLTVKVEVRSENDLLGKKLTELIDKNNEVMYNIGISSEQVATGASQISDASIALSGGATEQASAIEELTASLEEISSQTKLNAQNANQANQLTEEAKNSAVIGNTQMNDMLIAMEDINESSANISKIIKVIDDIAFQTNILALNAAVEAARAGQHGKGFAVVAEEVRNLAARSANAAKETTDMIEASIKKAEGGTKIAKETALGFQNIVTRIEDVAKLVNNIAVASNEQASGIEQINQGIIQVSEVVQTNSATAEESAAASEELSQQAILLKKMVERFRLKESYNKTNHSDNINPEVMAMLDHMANEKKKTNYGLKNNKEDAASGKPRIVLNQTDFGKY